MKPKYNLRDQLLKITRALPAAASTSVTSTSAINLGVTANGAAVFDGEFVLTAPALTTTMAPDTKTMTYDIIESDNADLSSPTTIIAGAIVQTGAGGVGAATAERRFKVPTTSKSYIGLKVTSGANITDSSTVSATLELVF